MAKLYYFPKLSRQQQAAVERGEFDFLMPFQKHLLRTDEVCEVIGRSQQFIRELIECGRLESHQDSVRGTRNTNMVTRRSVILYLAETSNYDPSFLVLRIESLLKKLTPAALRRLIATASKLLERIS